MSNSIQIIIENDERYQRLVNAVADHQLDVSALFVTYLEGYVAGLEAQTPPSNGTPTTTEEAERQQKLQRLRRTYFPTPEEESEEERKVRLRSYVAQLRGVIKADENYDDEDERYRAIMEKHS